MQCEGFGGVCHRQDAMEQRQNTAYEEESRNWRVLCPTCQEESNLYWQEKWAEYYASVFVASETEIGVVDELFEGLRKIAVKELK